ncbi:Alcohol dehydrogenase GroES-like domain [Geosmithia morbida]|uniref:Alcohol dehydrogenase GroES-like domain n=1 Tax=Geosmithia morbida TaxID=1094350 RepID=A0A9P5D6C6_9HYPO|nr:Alcohol dehydrogenase GroES-like domain [Geosmithia morbida]KAF4125476.1 Alcohol dehydrogenase GroES-like domain [Geosmithia morbida]
MPVPIQSWHIESQSEDLVGLILRDHEPAPLELGDDEILVEMRAASLNYRDLVLATGSIPLKTRGSVIPSSDGSGVVLKTGRNIPSTLFKPGDKVVTHMTSELYGDSSLGDDEMPAFGHICSGLGQELDGTLTTQAVFHRSCLVKFGGDVSFEEAATLSCSAITAWNSLFGLRGHEVKKGDWVLVQGSGGVSVAALQFSRAVEATVVATTSSTDKGDRLRDLGASHVINYRDVPGWGALAKDMTPGKRGFDLVLDVAGNITLGESLKAVKDDGKLILAGMVGGNAEPVSMLSLVGTNVTARAVLLGTRKMMRDMVAFVQEKGIKMALDTEVFSLPQAKEAYRRLAAQKHFSKVVIRIPGN